MGCLAGRLGHSTSLVIPSWEAPVANAELGCRIRSGGSLIRLELGRLVRCTAEKNPSLAGWLACLLPVCCLCTSKDPMIRTGNHRNMHVRAPSIYRIFRSTLMPLVSYLVDGSAGLIGGTNN